MTGPGNFLACLVRQQQGAVYVLCVWSSICVQVAGAKWVIWNVNALVDGVRSLAMVNSTARIVQGEYADGDGVFSLKPVFSPRSITEYHTL